MDNDFDYILLEEEQKELLVSLVEAWRNIPRNKRRKFSFFKTVATTQIMGLGDIENPYEGDIEALGRVGLLNISYGSRGSLNFDITPFGFRYYEHLKQKSGLPAQVVEETTLSFLESDHFKSRYPEACAKLNQTMELLWSSDSQRESSTIGHHCREAMQFFASSLVEQHDPKEVTPEIDKTVKRIEAVLKHHSKIHGKTTVGVLEALLGYWAEINKLVQRQEHGAQKEGQQLRFEDARQVVFNTAFVMFEIDTILQRTPKR